MEIERKYLIKKIPDDLGKYQYREIEQGYLCQSPVVRIRKDNNQYYLTYKGKGLLAREEYNLPLTKESYEHLLAKIDGKPITKTRYMLPLSSPTYQDGFTSTQTLTIELDLFSSPTKLVMAEVEFSSLEMANAFVAPDWFGEDVTDNPAYHNVNMIYL